MTLDALLASAAIALTMTWTPGPNNVMLTASGPCTDWSGHCDMRWTCHWVFLSHCSLSRWGLGQAFQLWSWISQVLSWIGFTAMVWFSWKIATTSVDGHSPEIDKPTGKPLTLLQAAAFQWVNPKAWAFAIWISASYTASSDAAVTILIASLVFLLSGLGSSVAWSAFGAMIGKLLGTGGRMRMFNIAMASLLLGSAILLMIQEASQR